MNIHNLSSVQPDNPTDFQRHSMTMSTLIKSDRSYDYENIIGLLSPPPSITSFGLPGQFKNTKVGIIGGGLSGLSSAFELRKLGFDITVFEAEKNRIGGRVYTYYFNNNCDLYGELGAMRVPVSHETVWHYINLFKLNTIPFIQSNPNTFVYMRGIRTNNTPWNIMQNIYPKFPLTFTEYNTPVLELYMRVLRSSLKSIPFAKRSELLQILPEYSPEFQYFTMMSTNGILESSGLSHGAISLVTNLLPMVNAELYNSFAEELIEYYALNLTDLYQIAGGMAKLPLSFYKSLSSEFPQEYADIPQNLLGKFKWKSGCQVNGIYKQSSEEKIILSYADTSCHTHMYEDFDYIICALPLSEFRQIDIKPAFRDRKMQAIKEINYLDAQKTIFLCRKPFWEQGDASQRIIGGSSVTDLLIESMVYPSISMGSVSSIKTISEKDYSQRHNKPAIFIASYNAALDAVRLGSLNDAECFELIKRQVEEVHGLKPGYLDDIVIDFKTAEWNRETHFCGAYARFLPGQRKSFFYELSIPEYDNRVFFTGEHTSPNHAWMQGALHSGMLTANKVAYCCRYLHGHL